MIVLLALYPPKQADENKPYDNATSRNLSKCRLESGWYGWVDLLQHSPDGLSGDMNLKRLGEWAKTRSGLTYALDQFRRFTTVVEMVDWFRL
jgi:hypothetical protein